MEKTVLSAKVTGMQNGTDLEAPYRVVIFKRDDTWKLGPEQSFDGEFNEYSGLPSWELESLLSGFPDISTIPDMLYIDNGQKWAIRGLRAAIIEANQLVNWVFDMRDTERSYKSYNLGKFKIKDVDFVEHIGKDSDWKIQLKKGQSFIYRCSCCITFDKNELLIG